MASTDYDQQDNDYKPVPAARQIEAARSNELAESEAAERARRQEEIQADFERANREREAAEAEKEYRKQLADSKRAAELEREQETLREQHEARELRQRKKREQIQRAQAEHEESERIGDAADEAMREGARAKQRQERDIAGKMFGFTPLEPEGDPETIKKASFERAENRRMWQEFEEKGKVNRPHGPGAPRSKTVETSEKVFGKILGLGHLVKEGTKKHVKQSYNDLILVPFQPERQKDDPNYGKPYKRQSKPSPILVNILGGPDKPKRQPPRPRGLLSVTSFADPNPLIGGGRRKATTGARKKKGGKKRVAVRPQRSFLDRALFF